MAKKPGTNLRGKVAVISGGSQGIGLAIARAFVAEGGSVVITGRSQSKLTKAAKELARGKATVLPVVCDVRDQLDVGALFAAVEGRFHRLDVLVNNAGVAHVNATIEDLSLESWREVIDTNLTGAFLMVQSALRLMKRGGTIVNNLSISAKKTFPGASAYSASKHGALGFTNTLREELREKGIRVIALLPGATDTDIWNAFWPDAPRKKMMSPDTVAQALLSALLLPENATVEELLVMPSAGTL